MSNSNQLLWPKPPVIVSYGIGVLSVVAALIIVRWPALHLQAAPVSLFLCAVMFSAWFGGVRPGLLAISLSVLAFDYYFLPPIYSFALKTEEIPRLVIFFLSAVLVGSLSAAQRSATESLRRGRDALEVTGQELKRINEALRTENSGRKRVEAELRESEQQWRDVFENNPTMYFLVDAEGTVIAVNPFGAEQLGYTVDELVGQPVLSVSYEFDRETVQRKVALCLKQLGQSMSWELRKVRKDGSLLWVRETARAALRTNDPVVLIACEDITGSKSAEEKIRQQELELRQFLDLTPQHFAVLGPDRNRLSSETTPNINQAALDYHGVTIDEWRSSDPRKFFHPDDWERLMTEDQSKFLSGFVYETEARLLRSDGKYRWFLFRHNPMRNEQGRITRWYVAGTDIEDRKQAEGALREQANLLNLTHDSIFVRDIDGVITYWNRGAEQLYGWTREEALDKVSHQLTQTIFPEPLAEINAELLRTGRWEGELVHTKRDGTQVVVASRWSLQRNEQGLPAAILETNNDITEKKRAEEALRQAQSDLAHVGRVTTLGEMTASIAHEIKQPLAAVVTNGSACLRWLALDSPNLDEARDAARRVIRDGNRANEVIARIRALMRKTDIKKTRLNINEVIDEVISLTRNEAARKGVTLRMELAHDLPPVFGDRVQLQQLTLNLLMNGVEAMAVVNDRPRELLIQSQSHESDHVLIAVQDCGIGIAQEDLAKIFAAFYTTKSQGMGMGLAICRSIVENHGGRLWAAPNEGPGVTFQFTLLRYDHRNSKDLSQ